MSALQAVRSRAGAAPVELGIVLGSGLGHLAASVDGVAIPYGELPGFPRAAVSGHDPHLVIGMLEGRRVAVFGGRAHYYEAGDPAAMRMPIGLLQALGAGRLVLTNAAGSLRPDMAPGELMLLTDHINFSGRNPLIGEATDARFVNMVDAYDPAMRRALREAAAAEEIRSMGAKAFDLELETLEGAGVYAREMTEDRAARQKELLAEFGDIELEKSGHKSFLEKIASYFS